MENRRIRVGNTHYPILKTLARGRVERLLVGDPDRSMRVPAYQVIILPRNETSQQQITTLRRISKSNENLPTIVRQHAHQDRCYLVTTWIDGRDLEHVLNRLRQKKDRWPSVHQSCRLARGLAHGLHHFNDLCGLVHGDIAPRNLIVTHKMRKLALVDYGSAWAVERTADRKEGDGHTKGYAAPEMSDPAIVPDFRVEQFSLSCVAYKMLTDQLPYDGLGGLAGTEKYQDSKIALLPPSENAIHRKRFPRRVWAKIDAVICRGLALSPSDRYSDTRKWLNDWDEVILAIERPGLADPLGIAKQAVRSLFTLRRNTQDS
jgi:serine/threonine protein kinase